jgi:tetratricopeptide (TPR) repeat protein
MKVLEPPDSHFLSAAEGWLELGRPDEATRELDQIAPVWRNHPDVLERRWHIAAYAREWCQCLELARSLIDQEPTRVTGWIHQAYALRRVGEGGLQLAWDALLPAAGRFPRNPIIPFNLACYACQMGRMDEARQWLARAFSIGRVIGTEDSIKSMALQDQDLVALWDEIKKKC